MYKRQHGYLPQRDRRRQGERDEHARDQEPLVDLVTAHHRKQRLEHATRSCLLYTSDAADERSSVDLGGRRIIKKKKQDSDMGRSVLTNTQT